MGQAVTNVYVFVRVEVQAPIACGSLPNCAALNAIHLPVMKTPKWDQMMSLKSE